MFDRVASRGPRAFLSAALLVGALLAAGCGGPPLAPADAAARVGDRIVPYSEFESYVSTRVGLESTTSSQVLSGLLDQFLDELLLRSLAVDEGRVDPTAAGWQVVDTLLEGREAPPVSEAEIDAFYRAYPDSFARPERVVLNQVLAEESATAARLAERLAAGDEIAVLTADFGDSVIISQSEITREDLPIAFVDRIFALDAGEVSEVIDADYGFHVFQVVSRLAEKAPSLEEARPRIADLLRRQGRRRALENLVAEARGRYNVEVFARNLPFNYEGQYDSPNALD